MTGIDENINVNVDNVKVIAFYLPQFHPIPQNDEWWGKGFTEWTNVTKAVPLFDGHYQPHLPTDLGFYDLRLRASRREQIAYAKRYGIYGFCYHYYWFSGVRILNEPVDDMLNDDESDMPFCLCWANENWTRRWDGAEHQVLIAQKYHADDDINFIKDLEPFLRDRRYIRVNGASVLVVYMPQALPDATKTLTVWRNYCRDVGLGELHLVAALTHGNIDYKKFGFDAAVEFPPHNLNVESVNSHINFFSPHYGYVFEYHKVARFMLERKYGVDNNVYRTVCPSWDNTARTGSRAVMLLNGTPENYEFWLKESVRLTRSEFPDKNRLLFVNAWNEWAEGCHLEPDRRFGLAFLEATERVIRGASNIDGFTHTGTPRLITDDQSFFGEICSVVRKRLASIVGSFKVWAKQRPRLKKMLHYIHDKLINNKFTQ